MYVDWFSDNISYLAQLDQIYAKAQFTLELSGAIPLLSPNGTLDLKQAYNPLLKIKSSAQKEVDPVVPLRLRMEPSERCLMITGPNAGGKSVAMKTICISTVMVQCGWCIPADPNSEVPIVTGWFVDMGDDQLLRMI